MMKDARANCDECPLRDEPYAPSVVPEGATTFIVGEAPGREEARTGVPFVGASGRLLDTVLAYHGIDREQLAITNTVLCRPPGNANPPQEAIRCCAGRLHDDLSKAEVIVPLGNFAASAVLDRKTKITKDRVGPAKRSDRFPKARIIPTIHPAACLRAADNFPSMLTDIGKIKMASTVEWAPPRFKVVDNVTQACVALGQLALYDPITLDIETLSEKDESFTHPKELLAVGIGFAPKRSVVFTREVCASDKFRRALASVLRKKKIICQHGKFDLQVLHAMGIGTFNLWFDTMLASYCLDERGGVHGLDYLGLELLGTPDWKSVRKKYGGFESMPDDVLYEYNAYDTGVTYDLWELFEPQLEDEGQRDLHDMLVRFSNALYPVEAKGIRVDEARLERLYNEFEHDLEELRSKLQKMTGKEDFNPNSWQQVLAFYTANMKRPPKNTQADTLKFFRKKMKGKVAEFTDTLLLHRSIAKLHGTYVKGVRRRTDGARVHTTIALHTTTTGRTSSRNPNLQNQPRGEKIRSIFIPDYGKLFIQADYANIEGRIVAVESGCQSMIDIFESGRDLHGEVATRFFGDGWTKEQRVLAKTIVHGTNYGRTSHGIASDPDINASEREAAKFIKLYFEMFPEVEEWHQEIYNMVFKTKEHLVTPFGRKRRFMLITRDNAEDVFKEALAFKPQSIGSDITMTAFARLKEQGIDLLLPVHDSILAQAPQDEAEHVAQVMKEIMEDTAKIYTDRVSFPVEYEIGKDWGQV